MTESNRLTWVQELQAIAQTGLAFTPGSYDHERYQALRDLAARIMAAHTKIPTDHIVALFAGEQGYATPKIDLRGATLDAAGRTLPVRETADG